MLDIFSIFLQEELLAEHQNAAHSAVEAEKRTLEAQKLKRRKVRSMSV